ncbi:integrin alpha-5 [Engraulis encrasicolus]|uniref:integrin alpha-5 n=1 Tax=Engraulis encrasicolus TaxID=184585 RepID=UPI002FCF9605
MGSTSHRSAMASRLASQDTLLCSFGLSIILLQLCAAFNLDVENPSVYSGPEGSYFGYAVDFYLPNTSSVSIIVGAPKANTSKVNIVEEGSVFHCPWSTSQADCHSIEFDHEDERSVIINDTSSPGEFKSHQWFGATVRSHGDTILACAPLYSWRTEQDEPQDDVTGTCFLSVNNLTKFVEYAPCRSELYGYERHGYCQGGFSSDFTKDGTVVLGGPGCYFGQGQVVAAVKEEIIRAYYPGYFLSSVHGEMRSEIHVKTVYNDDNYMGYAMAVGEFTDDNVDDFVAGIPKGEWLHGLVAILNGTDMTKVKNFTGEQMGSYYGYSVATTDINNDGHTDLLVGAPLFMMWDKDRRLEERGRVYVYLQKGPLDLQPQAMHLTGTEVYSRFGSSIAALGDLNQDGFNDVAIGCPFGGEDQQGVVHIYNGHSEGLQEKPSQILSGQWASSTMPSSFGFTLRGNKDMDMNGYPDLIVGAFGADKAVVYRGRPIVNTSVSLVVHPAMINPEEKHCLISRGNETIAVSCVNLSFCLLANGKHLPDNLAFRVEVQLDRQKQKQKGPVRRALFVDDQQPSLVRTLAVPTGARRCHETKIYLRDEKEFRDKLSAIYVALNFSLDPQAAHDQHGLRPILNYQTTEVIEQKAQILLDCGEDNICVPDLKLSVTGDKKEVYLGDENSVTLTFNARNDGGGAYEAELHVVLPPEADYSGIARNNESLAQLTCSYETENQTRYLSCDLGNPMKSGTNLWAGLRFTIPRLKDTRKVVQFDAQIRSKNENNSHSEMVPFKLDVVVQSDVILQGVSRPDKIYFPPTAWKVTKKLEVEEDVGPEVSHVYELVNNGPSRISHTALKLHCPMRLQTHQFMYPLEVITEGPLNCTTNRTVNPNHLKLQQPSTQKPPLEDSNVHHIEKRETHKSQMSEISNLSCSTVDCWVLSCNVGLLERGTSAILKVRSRIWGETFLKFPNKNYILECQATYDVLKMPYSILPKEYPNGAKKVATPVVWNKPDSQHGVPLWIIILSILAGLLLLALLIFVLYKLGFFKRTEYGTAMEKAQLKPPATSEA